MIISRAKNFGFVHVPKCAGSTIRWPMKDEDDFDGFFFGSAPVADLGQVNLNHLPMAWLREYFPQAYSALQDVESYSIVRDPMDRFISAVAQRARALEKDPGSLRRKDILGLTEESIAYVRSLEGFPDAKRIYFAPQHSFIFAGKEQGVTHIWPVERMPQLLNRLETNHQIVLKRNQTWNPTVTYRQSWMAAPLKNLKDVAKKSLPTRQYAFLRDAAVRVFTTKGAPLLEDTIRNDNKISAFVKDYYAQDAELHREILNNF